MTPAQEQAYQTYAQTYFQGKHPTPQQVDYNRLEWAVNNGFATPFEEAQYQRVQTNMALGLEAPGEASTFERLGGAWSVGYGGMAALQGVEKAYQPAAMGNMYQPAQAAEQAGTSTLPLFASLGASAIGFSLGGSGGAMAGQFIGQTIGGGAQTLIDSATDSRIFAPERAGQQIAAGRGGADEVEKFAEAIRNSGTPAIAELTSKMTELSRVLPMGTGFAAGYAQTQTALGFAAPQVMTDAVSALQQTGPGAYPLLQEIGANGKLTPAQAQQMAQLLAAGGDEAGSHAMEALYEAGTTPVAPRSGGRLAGPASSVARGALAPFAGMYYDLHNEFVPTTQAERDDQARIIDPYGHGWGGRSNPDYQPARPKSAAEQAAQTANEASAQNINDILASANSGRFGVLEAETQTRLGMSAIQLGELQGGGAASIRAALPGLQNDITSGGASYARQIANYQKVLASPNLDPTVAAQTAQSMADLQTTAAQEPIELATVRRQAFDMGQQERIANYGSAGSAATLSLTMGELSGRTYHQLQPQENRLLANQTSEADELMQQARDYSNPLSPAERAAYATQSRTITGQVAESRYSYRMGDYSQTVSGDEVASGAAGYAVNAARRHGGADEVFAATTRQIESLTHTLGDLNNQLDAGNLKVADRQRLEAQRNATADQVDALRVQSVVDAAQTRSGIYQNDAAIAQTQYGMDAQVLGSGTQTYSDLNNVVASATKERATQQGLASNQTQSAKVRSDASRQVQELTAQIQDAQLQKGNFLGLDPAAQTKMAVDQGRVDRMSSSFIEPGDLNDARKSLMDDISATLAGINKQMGDVLKDPKLSPDVRSADILSLTRTRERTLDQQAQVGEEMDTSWAQRLPSMVIGGGSFSERLIPTAAQSALRMEQTGHGDMSARVFGFYSNATGRSSAGQVSNLPGSVSYQPGNSDYAALDGLVGSASVNTRAQSAAIHALTNWAIAPTATQSNNPVNDPYATIGVEHPAHMPHIGFGPGANLGHQTVTHNVKVEVVLKDALNRTLRPDQATASYVINQGNQQSGLAGKFGNLNDSRGR